MNEVEQQNFVEMDSEEDRVAIRHKPLPAMLMFLMAAVMLAICWELILLQMGSPFSNVFSNF